MPLQSTYEVHLLYLLMYNILQKSTCARTSFSIKQTQTDPMGEKETEW